MEIAAKDLEGAPPDSFTMEELHIDTTINGLNRSLFFVQYCDVECDWTFMQLDYSREEIEESWRLDGGGCSVLELPYESKFKEIIANHKATQTGKIES